VIRKGGVSAEIGEIGRYNKTQGPTRLRLCTQKLYVAANKNIVAKGAAWSMEHLRTAGLQHMA